MYNGYESKINVVAISRRNRGKCHNPTYPKWQMADLIGTKYSIKRTCICM